MEVKIKSMKYEEFNDNEYLEQLRASGTNVIVGCLDDVINWGRSEFPLAAYLRDKLLWY